jgi:predicted PurR-regulated permease PerM
MNTDNVSAFERRHEQESNQLAAPSGNDWSSRNHIYMLVLLAATAIGIYLCYRLAEPFLPALAWALALAVLFIPFHRRLESKIKNPSLAASISVLVIGLIVVVPAAFVGQRLISEAVKGVDTVRTKFEAGEWRRGLEARPRLAPIAKWIERHFDLPGAVQTGATWLTTKAGSFLKGSMMGAIGVCLTFYLLFYFLRDHRAALSSFRSLSPLSEMEMNKLFSRVGDAVYATIYGTLAVAIVQGTLGGLMFWWLSLSAPLLWGVVMSLLAVVPVLGAFVVWIPAALLLALEGSWGKALILTVWGGLVVGGIDNVLYPVLVGNRLKLHTVLAFIAVVGGLIVFGPSGLILGPVVLTVTQLLLEIWRSRTADPQARTQPALMEGKPG